MSGAVKFKNSSGNVVSYISGSETGGIIMSGSLLDLSGVSSVNLGNIIISGDTLNAETASYAPKYTLTSSFNTFSSSVSSVLPTLATTGSNTFIGQQTFAGNVIPSSNSVYDLGDPTHQFRHLYLSSASLYIDGTKVLGSTSQELQITTDVGQSFKILETNSDTITLQSADGNITLAASGGGDVILDPTNGIIALKGTVTMYSGNKILSSDGNPIQFGNGIVVTGSIVSTGTAIVSGSSQIVYSGITGTPNGIVSGSSQIIYSGITGTPSGIVSGSSQLTGSYDTRYVLSGSITQTTWNNIANKPSGIVSGSAQVDVTQTTNYSTLATTGSNSFIGTQTITGSLYVSQNLIVQGSSSLQDVTGSNVYIGTNKINLNTSTPAIRFGGISVFDSGSSFGESGSLLWDSVNNRWLYQHPISSGAPYKSAILISGPMNSGSLGSEGTLTAGKIMKSLADDHIGDSIITETNGGIGINGALSVTGSFNGTNIFLTNGANVNSLLVNDPGGSAFPGYNNRIGGNTVIAGATILSGSAVISGSIVATGTSLVSGSSQIQYSGITGTPSGIISGSSQLPSGLVSGSSQISYTGITNVPSGLVSGSSQVIYSGLTGIPTGIISGSAQITTLGFATTGSIGGVSSSSSVRIIDTFTATANQSTFTSSQGYTVGLIDVYVNGSKLAAADFVATNGTTVVLNVAAEGGETVELYSYVSTFTANNSLRTITSLTATAGQTSFTGLSYNQNFVEVYYNGSRLSSTEYTATNGSSIVLGTAANAGDVLDVIAYNYTVGGFTGLGGSGTAGYIPKMINSNTLGNSSIQDASGSVTINGTLVATGTTLVSGSGQILSGTTIHSGSFFNGITVVSGSGQISYTGITNIPSGIVSSSTQVTNYGFATTGSNTLQGNQTVNGSLIITGSITAQQFIVSSSVTYLTESFASGSHKFGDTSDDYHDFTGSVRITGSLSMTGSMSNIGTGLVRNVIESTSGAQEPSINFKTTSGSFYLGAYPTSNQFYLDNRITNARTSFQFGGTEVMGMTGSAVSITGSLSVKSQNSTFGIGHYNAAGTLAGGFYNTSTGHGQIYLYTSASVQTVQIDGSTGTINIGGNVTGTSKLNIISANDQAGIYMNNTYTGNAWSIRTGTYGINNTGLGFYDETNSTTRLQLTSDGKVGINTLTPDTFLTIDGQVGASSTITLAKFYSSKGNSDGNYLRVNGTRHPTAQRIEIDAYNGANTGSVLALQGNSSGLVGINTLTPLGTINSEQTLHLSSGNAGYATLYVTNGANTVKAIVAIQSSQNIVTMGSQSNSDFVLRSNDTERIRVTTGGTIGIGGITPAANANGTYIGSTEIAGILRIQGSGGRYFTSGDGVEISKSGLYSYNRGTSSYNTFGINDTISVIGGGGQTTFTANDGIKLVNSASQYRQIYHYNSNGGDLYFWNGTNQAYLGYAGVWTNASDVSIKKDIINIKYGLSDLMNLTPRSYKMKDGDMEQIGFIAQEVETIIPEVVTTDNKEMKGISYGNLLSLAIKAIQEQQQIISDLTDRITILENK